MGLEKNSQSRFSSSAFKGKKKKWERDRENAISLSTKNRKTIANGTNRKIIKCSLFSTASYQGIF